MSPQPPYDTVYNVLSTARIRLNDELKTLVPVGGKVLENNQVFTQQTANTAWRKFQEFMANLGYARLKQEVIITNVPASTQQQDPASQVYINWFGYFDGTTLQTGIVLPQDLMGPLKLYERQTGSDSQFIPMELIYEGLPTWGKSPLNRVWEWRNDAIYMPGATFATDLRLLYLQYLSDFADDGSTPWFGTAVPIVRCQDALSWFICAEFASARSDLGVDAEKMWEKGESAAKLIMNRDAKMKQRGNVRRLSRSGRLESNYQGSWGACN